MAKKRAWRNGDVLLKRDSKGRNIDIALFKNKKWVYSNFYFWRIGRNHHRKVHTFKSKGFSYSVYVRK